MVMTMTRDVLAVGLNLRWDVASKWVRAASFVR